MTAIPGSRLGRLLRLGWLSRHSLPLLGRASNPASPRRLREAEEIFLALGRLKGLALKAGQMLSYMDGFLPESHQSEYRHVLSRLQQDAPSLPWSEIEPVITADLGCAIGARFRDIELTPFAAASIGQVHRGILLTGERVAIKVQYPDIERAVAADLQNISSLKRLMAPMLRLAARGGAASVNLTAILEEVGDRLREELDYEREARMQMRFRDLLADDAEIWIPRVYPDCSGRRVLTSELAVGRPFDEMCASASQVERDRVGAILTRTMFRSLYEFHLFNGDPHPGNYLFPQEGRVVLLDFGCVKELPPSAIGLTERYLKAAVRATATGLAEHWTEVDRAIADAFQLDPDDREAFPLVREFILYCLRPYLRDEEFRFTPEFTGGSIDQVRSGVKKLLSAHRGLPRLPRLPVMPPDLTLMNRLQWGFYSVLTRLGASGNWHRMLPPHLREST